MSILTNPDACLLAVRWLLFTSIAISSLQNIANAGVYSNRGLLGWPFLRYAYQVQIFEKPVIEKLFGLSGFLTLNGGRILIIIAAVADRGLPWTLTALFIIQVALYIRSFLTMTAADQLNTILLVYLLIATWLPPTATLCCGAIAIQTLFCYFANGLIKVLEPRWTSGVHLKAILLTENYSRNIIAKKAANTGLPAFRLLSRAVIVWELAAAIAPFLPRPLLYIFLGFGVLFHLAIALVMGLNTFFWSFLSTYPAILFLNKQIDVILK